jgi:hypothetical protein
MYSNESVESLRWIKRILTVFSLRILEQGRAYGEDGDGHGVHECWGLVGHVLPAVPLPVGEPDEFLYDLERIGKLGKELLYSIVLNSCHPFKVPT